MAGRACGFPRSHHVATLAAPCCGRHRLPPAGAVAVHGQFLVPQGDFTTRPACRMRGLILASLPDMILSILNVNSSAPARTEVSQTLASLAPLIRKEEGCLRCDFRQESEQGTAFTIIEEWRDREHFDKHLRSRLFGVILGLAPLLAGPVDVSICTVVAREGMEAVTKARRRAVAH